MFMICIGTREGGGGVIFYGGDARKNARRIIALIDRLERF